MPEGPADLEYDPDADVYRIPDVHAAPGGISTAVVTAVAAIEDTPIEDLEPLSDRVDPEALDEVFEPLSEGRRRGGVLRFSFEGCAVAVESEGTVRIDPGDGPAPSLSGTESESESGSDGRAENV